MTAADNAPVSVAVRVSHNMPWHNVAGRQCARQCGGQCNVPGIAALTVAASSLTAPSFATAFLMWRLTVDSEVRMSSGMSLARLAVASPPQHSTLLLRQSDLTLRKQPGCQALRHPQAGGLSVPRHHQAPGVRFRFGQQFLGPRQRQHSGNGVRIVAHERRHRAGASARPCSISWWSP